MFVQFEHPAYVDNNNYFVITGFLFHFVITKVSYRPSNAAFMSPKKLFVIFTVA